MTPVAAGVPLSGRVLAASGEGLVSVWRIELLHPLVAHFPIVLILLGTAFWLVGGSRRLWPRLEVFALPAIVTVIVAALSGWAATQTGFWADEVVGRELYDPRPLKEHENCAVIFAWVASGCAAGALIWWLAPLSKGYRRAVWWATTVALVSASGIIVYVSHLGAGLVYQQGAGVMMPQ